jgi:hypothetical protein
MGLQGVSHPATPRRGRRSFGQGKRRLGAGHCDPPRQVPRRPGDRRPGTAAQKPRRQERECGQRLVKPRPLLLGR